MGKKILKIMFKGFMHSWFDDIIIFNVESYSIEYTDDRTITIINVTTNRHNKIYRILTDEILMIRIMERLKYE